MTPRDYALLQHLVHALSWEVWVTFVALVCIVILLALRPPNGGRGSGD